MYRYDRIITVNFERLPMWRLVIGVIGTTLLACASALRSRRGKVIMSFPGTSVGLGTVSSPRVAANEEQAQELRHAWMTDPELTAFTAAGGQHVSKPCIYHDGELAFHGQLAWAEGGPASCLPAKRPGVLLVHTAVGPHDLFLHWRAQNLASRGYVVLIVDLLGDDRGAGWEPEWAAPRRQAYIDERPLLARRMLLAMETLAGCSLVDPDYIAALGFCFGGRAVLDLLRSEPAGAALRGVVSFHGILDAGPLADGLCTPVQARALICHADQDPFVPPEALNACLAQLRSIRCDWQLLCFGGGTLHGFTNPAQALNPKAEFAYDARAARAAWEAARQFLEEIFP